MWYHFACRLRIARSSFLSTSLPESLCRNTYFDVIRHVEPAIDMVEVIGLEQDRSGLSPSDPLSSSARYLSSVNADSLTLSVVGGSLEAHRESAQIS